MPPIPPNHPQRYVLNNEVHARPYEALRAPERFSHIVLLPREADRCSARDALAELCARYHAPPPAPDADHYSGDCGSFRVRWERHLEFATFTFIVHGPCDDPFAPPALARVPQDWLAALPGQLMVAAHGALQAATVRLPDVADLAHRHFAGNTLVGATIAGGAARAYTDFHIHADGCSRILVCDIGLGTRQAGRVFQRLFEIDGYRLMALRGLPVAQDMIARLQNTEVRLAEINNGMTAARKGDEPALLDRIIHLAAEVENGIALSQYRFDASSAYYALMSRRIEELREERIHGLQTFLEFTERRLLPAMNTCDSVARWQQRLSERIGRTSQLLSTRVGLIREGQNQEMLASMSRRAQMRLRLQEAVEGLSIAAITYYTVGLIGYIAKAAKGAGLAVNPDVVTGLSIPVVALLIVWGVRRLKKRAVRER